MQRVKSFQATGVAPDGRLYAGDLNAIQDAAAAKSDFTQTIDLATVRIGETGLQLVRYGPAEARITGALRADGIVRGLGGIISGAFTTAQRDAIATGLAPYGIVILNTTTNQYEFNAGTDTARDWRGFITSVPQGETTGVIKMWPTLVAPAGYLLCDGSAVSRATFSALHAVMAAASYPYGNGDGSTTFHVPDFRGRTGVGVGTNGDVDSIGENDGEALANRRPRHKHSVSATFNGTPAPVPGGGGPGPQVPTASFNPAGAPTLNVTVGPQTNSPLDGPAFLVVNYIIKT